MTKFSFRWSTIVLALVAHSAMAANNVTTFPKPAVRDAWADIATSTDLVDPGNSFASAGWPQSSTPPARQYFNWVLNYASNGVRYFSQRGIVDYDPLETYQVGAVIQSGNVIYRSLTNNNIGNTPVSGSANWAGIAVGSNSTLVGPVTISAPPSGTALTVTASGGSGADAISANAGVGTSPSTVDTGEIVSLSNLSLSGDQRILSFGQVGNNAFIRPIGPAVAANLLIATAGGGTSFSHFGNVTIAAPSSGNALTVNSLSGSGPIFSTPAAADNNIQFSLPGVDSLWIGTNNSGSTNSIGAPNGSDYFYTNQGRPLSFGTLGTERLKIGGDGSIVTPGQTPQGAGTINAAALFVTNTNISTLISNAQAAAVSTSEAFTSASVAGLAPLSSPGLTGNPTAPTAAPGTNTTQIATTAFVQATSQGSCSLTPNGWCVDPSGKVTMWGSFPGTGSSPQVVLFPKPGGFPHAVFSVVATVSGNNENYNVVINSNTSFSMVSVSGLPFYWQAVGN